MKKQKNSTGNRDIPSKMQTDKTINLLSCVQNNSRVLLSVAKDLKEECEGGKYVCVCVAKMIR